jgi:hypothetical protein
MTTDEKAADAVVAQRRELERTRVLADLFGRRPELAGVHAPADLSAEALLWSA